MELETTDTTQIPLLTPTIVTDKAERELDVIFRLLAERGRRIRVQALSSVDQTEEQVERRDVCLPASVSA